MERADGRTNKSNKVGSVQMIGNRITREICPEAKKRRLARLSGAGDLRH